MISLMVGYGWAEDNPLSTEERLSKLERENQELKKRLRDLEETIDQGGGVICTSPGSTAEGKEVATEAPPPAKHMIQMNETSWLDVGLGIRGSYRAIEDAAPSRDDFSTNRFQLDDARLYFNAQVLPHVKMEFNTEYQIVPQDLVQLSPGGFTTLLPADTTDRMRVLDAIGKFELNDYVNFWGGLLLPPSDRANLDGPFYQNVFDFPFVQNYPNVFAGRDYGLSFWGQLEKGKFTYELGVFRGRSDDVNKHDNPMWAIRLMYDFWDPEPGYYTQSTYYGAKDILAVGVAGMFQTDGVGHVDPATGTVVSRADFAGASLDFLLEKKIPALDNGVVTFEGIYYKYAFSHVVPVDDRGLIAGDAYLLTLLYLFGPKIWIGQFQPYVRWQQYHEQFFHHSLEQIEGGINYVILDHKARISLFYTHGNVLAPSPLGSQFANAVNLGAQFQY